MVPAFEDFFYPFVHALQSGEKSLSDMREYLKAHFNLSSEDLTIKTRGGNTTQFNDRINWCRQYLKRAMFIESPKRGVYKITKRGRDYMSNHKSLHSSDLMNYLEFANFALGGHRAGNFNPDGTSEQAKQEAPVLDVRTPTEIMDAAFQNINNDLADELLSQIMQQSPEFFEKLVVDLLLKIGYGGSDTDSGFVTRYSQDDGIDGVIKEDKLGLDTIYIQAKRWGKGHNVGRPDIQTFVGALSGQGANKGVFITTSTFSTTARQYHPNGIRLVLIDGLELTKLMIEYNVGVSVKRSYDVKRLDLDYFDE